MARSLVFRIELMNFIPNLYLEKIIFYYFVANYEVLKCSSVRNRFEIKSIASKRVYKRILTKKMTIRNRIDTSSV